MLMITLGQRRRRIAYARVYLKLYINKSKTLQVREK